MQTILMQLNAPYAIVNDNRKKQQVGCGQFVNLAFKQLVAIALLAGLAVPAYAQVCSEPNGSGAAPANMKCDMRYRNTVVTCDAVNTVNPPTTNSDGSSLSGTPVTGTRPSCPPKPMPMIDTPVGSYISDYTKYLYIYPRDAADGTIPYSGRYRIGTPGSAMDTFQMFGNTAPGTKRLAACTAQLKPPEKLADDTEWARFIRLQLDNCTNQYILNTAIGPVQKENTKLLAMDADPFDPNSKLSKLIDLESECQPLRMARDTTNEYNPTEYLRWAWKKTLQDPSARKSTQLLKCKSCDIATVSLGLPCDHEPHLPCAGFKNQGIIIENPLTPPAEFRDFSLSELSAIQYEEIVDPTHPFSPRWDYLYADRDYSADLADKSKLAGGNSLAIITALRFIGTQYMTDNGFKGSTFCAGVKKADKETDSKKKKDLEVKVDVLEFRRDAYEKALLKRMMYNFTCKKWTANYTSGNDGAFYVIPTSFCYQITGFSWVYPWVYAKDFDCWDCFGIKDDKVDDENSHAPCTHHYLGKDLTMVQLPGGLNGFKKKANCGTDMATICRDLRKPFTPMNKLKMRYHNPDDRNDTDQKNVVLKDGALEGLSFNDYFDNRMPYPRIWDLGQSLQKTSTSDSNNQPELDTTGQYTTIVGVGREAAAKVASDAASPAKDANGQTPAEKYTDQRCKTMGWGTSLTPGMPMKFGGLSVYPPDPMTSWTELKLYQARTQRNVGLSCIARYEKVFKPGSAENMLMWSAGAEWDRTVVNKCNRGPNGKALNCVPMTYKEYEDAGKPADSNTVVYMKQTLPKAWTNAWRGYMAAYDYEIKFPNFGDSPPTLIQGLDDAEMGDIILMPDGPRGPMIKPGLAKVAFVAEVRLPNNSSCVAEKNCYIKVLEPDGGKWPDICGTTDTWGEMKERYYFKPGHLPKAAADEYERIGSASHCGEMRLAQCEQKGWDSFELYRIREDERVGCNKQKAADCF